MVKPLPVISTSGGKHETRKRLPLFCVPKDRAEYLNQLGALIQEISTLPIQSVFSKIQQSQPIGRLFRLFATDLDPHPQVLTTQAVIGFNVVRANEAR